MADIQTITGTEFNDMAGEMELDLLAAFKIAEVSVDEMLSMAEEKGWSIERLMREISKELE